MFPLYFLHSLTLFSHLKVQAFAFFFPLYLAVLFPVFRVQRYAFSSLPVCIFCPLILHRSLINCLTFRSTRCSHFFSFRCIFPRLSLSLLIHRQGCSRCEKNRTAPHRNFCPLTPHRTAPQIFSKIAHCTAPHRRHFQKSRTAPHRTARKIFQTLNYKEKNFLKCSNRL